MPWFMTPDTARGLRGTSAPKISYGTGQLSLVEHALCPLAARPAGENGGVYASSYQYTDSNGRRQTALVRVISPLGLMPSDEFYLWGLLALTLSQPEPRTEFHATPHYCLRQLGIIDQRTRRGGRQYSHFTQALERLSAVTYQNDGFYDPVRREHRRVAFGFLSYSLPLDPASSRAWRIAWDSVFLEFASVMGGHLRFDFDVYRRLDAASRRLFLLVSKLFRRQRRTPAFDLRFLGQEVLGFAPSLATRDLKVKVKRCVEQLAEHNVVDGHPPIHVGQAGTQVVQLSRGTHFARRKSQRTPKPSIESPLVDLMLQIGLDARGVERCLSRFPVSLLQQWLDITLAAREKHGPSFFKKSAAAYFVDNVQKAAQGQRTPPDWWHDLVRDERRLQAESVRHQRARQIATDDTDPHRRLLPVFERQFQAAGQTPEQATDSARQFVTCCREQETPLDVAALLKLLT